MTDKEYRPTMRLRWKHSLTEEDEKQPVQVRVSSRDWSGEQDFVLQQLWVADDGTEQWRYVEVSW